MNIRKEGGSTIIPDSNRWNRLQQIIIMRIKQFTSRKINIKFYHIITFIIIYLCLIQTRVKSFLVELSYLSKHHRGAGSFFKCWQQDFNKTSSQKIGLPDDVLNKTKALRRIINSTSISIGWRWLILKVNTSLIMWFFALVF